RRELGPPGQSTAMERFIRRENIKRYRKLLLEAKDEAERRLIQRLLTEEEQKEPPPEAPSPATAPRLTDLSFWRLPAFTNVSDTADRVRNGSAEAKRSRRRRGRESPPAQCEQARPVLALLRSSRRRAPHAAADCLRDDSAVSRSVVLAASLAP